MASHNQIFLKRLEVLHLLLCTWVCGLTQDPSASDPRFEFTSPLLSDFVERNRDEMLLCVFRTFRSIWLWLNKTIKLVLNFFVSLSKRKKQVSQNTIPFRVRLIINHVYGSSSEADFSAVEAKAHDVHKIGSSFLSGRNCTARQVLEAVHGFPRWWLLLFMWEMSPTDIWIHFPLVQWWQHKRSHSSVAL